MKKIFKELTNNSLVDNLIIQNKEYSQLIVIRTTCGREGSLEFNKAQIKAIAKYLLEICK